MIKIRLKDYLEKIAAISGDTQNHLRVFEG